MQTLRFEIKNKPQFGDSHSAGTLKTILEDTGIELSSLETIKAYNINETLTPAEAQQIRNDLLCDAVYQESREGFAYAKELDYVKYIKVGNGMEEANKTIIADVFEALIAVVYLESGLDAVKKIFNELIVPYIKRKDDFLMDYKSLLQESVQTVKKSVTYNLVEESGPAHHKVFKSQVIIDDLVYGEGVGFTKKEAEQNAAKDAYIKRAN